MLIEDTGMAGAERIHWCLFTDNTASYHLCQIFCEIENKSTCLYNVTNTCKANALHLCVSIMCFMMRSNASLSTRLSLYLQCVSESGIGPIVIVCFVVVAVAEADTGFGEGVCQGYVGWYCPMYAPSSCGIGPALFPYRRLYKTTKPGISLCCSIFVFLMSVCFCCVRFSFFSTAQRDWLGRTSPK